MGGAGVDGDVRAAEFDGVEGVAGGLLDAAVAGDGGDGADVDRGRAQGHNESDGVVGCGVGVDEDGAGHGLSLRLIVSQGCALSQR